MRVLLAGAVTSTRATLEALYAHGIDVVGVLGYEPVSLKNVSAYSSLSTIAEKHNTPYEGFIHINDDNVAAFIKDKVADVLMVIGLSQLVGQHIIDLVPQGAIGFHPTHLPKGRGRAPIAWAILNEDKVGATFFKIGEGTDDGPILAQHMLDVLPTDYAEDVELKIQEAIRLAMPVLAAQLLSGDLKPIVQDESEAYYYARRHPNDGYIDWNQSANEIHKGIRASSRPHPGAFSFRLNYKILIWRAIINTPVDIITGVIGRVLDVNESGHALVQCGQGQLWITEYQVYDGEELIEAPLKVGQKLGYYPDLEINRLRIEINDIKNKLK